MKEVTKYLAHPFLLAMTLLIAIVGYDHIAPFVLLLLLLITTLTFLFLLEIYIPYRPDWKMLRRDFKEDSKYFGINVVADNLATITATSVAMYLAPEAMSLPIYLSIPFAVLLIELVGYIIHRASHNPGFLWQVHSVHHTPEKLYAWNNNVLHPINVLLLKFFRLGSLLILGLDSKTIFFATSFALVQNYISHTNADFKGGVLNYLIGTPELHRLHHSVKKEEALNYSGVIPLWDMLFGSYLYKEKVETIGVHNRSQYPIGFLSSLKYPFLNKVRKIKVWMKNIQS